MPAAGQRRGVESAPAQGPRSRTPLLAIAAAALLLLLLRRRR